MQAQGVFTGPSQSPYVDTLKAFEEQVHAQRAAHEAERQRTAPSPAAAAPAQPVAPATGAGAPAAAATAVERRTRRRTANADPAMDDGFEAMWEHMLATGLAEGRTEEQLSLAKAEWLARERQAATAAENVR